MAVRSAVWSEVGAAELTATMNPDGPYLDVDGLGLGTPDEDVTTIIDTREHLDARRAAIAAHASQTSPFVGLPGELADELLTVDPLSRVVPPWRRGAVEHDLSAGVDVES